jgi:hypothetical protein
MALIYAQLWNALNTLWTNDNSLINSLLQTYKRRTNASFTSVNLTWLNVWLYRIFNIFARAHIIAFGLYISVSLLFPNFKMEQTLVNLQIFRKHTLSVLHYIVNIKHSSATAISRFQVCHDFCKKLYIHTLYL